MLGNDDLPTDSSQSTTTSSSATVTTASIAVATATSASVAVTTAATAAASTAHDFLRAVRRRRIARVLGLRDHHSSRKHALGRHMYYTASVLHKRHGSFTLHIERNVSADERRRTFAMRIVLLFGKLHKHFGEHEFLHKTKVFRCDTVQRFDDLQSDASATEPSATFAFTAEPAAAIAETSVTAASTTLNSRNTFHFELESRVRRPPRDHRHGKHVLSRHLSIDGRVVRQ
jgi:hypothetical protein